ncbi:MAG TPA: CBS domain-containing protein, partial [Thermoanaerobaculia bacterium]
MTQQQRRVRDVMTANPATVSEKDSIRDVARIMAREDTGIVPVVDGKKIVGLITDRDIVVRLVAEGKDLANSRVKEVMSRSVRSVKEDTPINEVLDLMSTEKIRRVPVVNQNNELVGILSIGDIASRDRETAKVGKAIEEISEG